jgi:hypothetical protein
MKDDFHLEVSVSGMASLNGFVEQGTTKTLRKQIKRAHVQRAMRRT